MDILELVVIFLILVCFVNVIHWFIPSNKTYCLSNNKELMTDVRAYDGFPSPTEYVDDENIHDLLYQLV
jgi:hypothetical protein